VGEGGLNRSASKHKWVVRIAPFPRVSAADREHEFWNGMCFVNPDIEHRNWVTFELQD